MDPSVVSSAQFGELWKTKLPGNYRNALEQIYSQPLVYTLDDGIQYVFIATSQNNLYKINAKTGAIVASRNMHIPFLTSELVTCLDINPLIGVTGTGVIDPASDTWYLTAKTYEDQSDAVKGLANGRYYFHAIDVNTLAEKGGFPKPLEGTLARNNPNRMFQGGTHHQRPALLLTGQYIYAGFASHCVQYNFTGWVMGWDKSNGNLVERFTTEAGPEPNKVPGAGIWMSGGGLASDDKGSMYYSTGNGYASQLHGVPVPGRQPPTALEQAVVNMKINDDGSLNVADFFMPWEKEQLDGADKDLGTTPFELLPPGTFTCPNARRMGVVTGKSGKTYILNLDNLGGYQMGPNKLDLVPQAPIQNENSVYAGAGVYPLEGGYIYINVIQYQTHVFKFSCDGSGNPAFTKVADTPEKAAYVLGVGHGTTTSFNGQPGTGLYWMTDVDGYNLRIYNAVPQNGVLQLIKSANIPGVTKFSKPVFGDGKVYVGTNQGLLYAFGSPVNLPLTCTTPNDFGKISINDTSEAKTIQCQASVYTQIKSIALKNPTNFQILGLPSSPVDVLPGKNISFQAVFKPVAPGPLSVDVSIATSQGDVKYATNTPVSLKGIGTSAKPLLAVNPNTVTFNGVIVNQNDAGVTESVIFSNVGDGVLTVQGLNYSIISETGAYVTPNTTANGVQVGPFTFTNIPSTIAGNTESIVKVNFNPTRTGNFAVYVHVRSDGGTKIFDVFGTASSQPSALLEFEAADGSGRWIPYKFNNPPFTFGNVVQQKTKSLKMRLTNNGSSSAGALSVTVSKPPVGISGIIGAVNGVDLGEGTNLAAGESATAVLFCSVPKSQVNVDSYNGTAAWVMNTGDPNFGKQQIQFFCNAVAEQVGPLAANGSAIYRYNGCYKENNPGRQLKIQLYGKDPNMSNDKCITECAAKGYSAAATEYTDECWCGNRFPSEIRDETDCNYVCTGNSTQICGGNGYFHDHSHLSLFTNGKAQPALPNIPPSILPSVGAYNYAGCYTEGIGGRALSDAQTVYDEMTVAYCANFCSKYQYFGIEYSSECFCANSIGNNAKLVGDGDCKNTCSGNATQYCGGANRLTVYALNGTTPLPSGSSTTTRSGATSTGTSTSASSTVTPGVPTAVASAAPFAHKGCYTEATSGRALGDLFTAYDGMTVEKCAAFCSAYTYMAVEYMSECYCGNTIGTGAVVATNGGCTMACSGNAGQLCGGSFRLNFYQKGASASSSATSTTVVSNSKTSTGTSTTSTATGPAVVQSAVPFTHQGCYSEGTSGRALAGTLTASDTMTVEKCAAFCRGYTYMGVEYSTECYCGNIIGAGALPVTDGRCSMPCGGDKSQLCGGPNGLNFYKNSASASGSSSTSLTSTGTTSGSSSTTSTSSSASNSATGPITVQSVPGYGYLGCYSEGSNGRALVDLQNPIPASQVSVEACGVACAQYTYFGVEYSGECYCGNTIQAGSAMVAGNTPAITQCNMVCNADKNEYCGGPNRLNMYKKGIETTSSTARPSTTSASSTTPSSAASTSKPTTSSTTSRSSSSTSPSSAASTSKLSTSSTTSLSSSSSIPSTAASTSKSLTSSTTRPATLSTTTSSTSKSTSSSSILTSTSKTSTSTTSTSSLTGGPTILPGNANFTYTGCYTEATSGRALSKLIKADDKMAADMCLGLCYQYQYAGIEYGRECFCGDTLASTSIKAPTESQCNFKCPGDNTQICGAGNRLTLYTRKPAAPNAQARIVTSSSSSSTSSLPSPTSTSSISTSSSTRGTTSPTRAVTTSSSSSSSSSSSASKSSTTSTTSSSTLYPTPSQTISSYAYAGCANATSPLALNAISTTSTSMDLNTCKSYCTQNNYGLSGVQNGDTCYCGNGLQSFSALQEESGSTTVSKCNTPCKGNSTEICGARDYLSVWNATEAVKIPPTMVKQVGYYPLKGCYNSTIQGTTTSPLLAATSTSIPTSLSVESCVGFCATNGYAVAGMENGKTCSCNDKLSTSAEVLNLGECNVQCPINKREFCGAYRKTLVYVLDSTSVDQEGKPRSFGQKNEATIMANSTAY
ncbi:MAG: hypothetical protein Q9209_007544 [Squamulea sp. 1 TL-2023]